jgi:hypothetical protein
MEYQPKKLVLPRFYFRTHDHFTGNAGMAGMASMDTEMMAEEPLIQKKKEKEPEIVDVVVVAKPEVIAEDAKPKRGPSAYNVFVKETLGVLCKTHDHMTSKERFSLAIQMWNEQKKQNA